MIHKYTKSPEYTGKHLTLVVGRRTHTVRDGEILEGRGWERFVKGGLLVRLEEDVPAQDTKVEQAPKPKPREGPKRVLKSISKDEPKDEPKDETKDDEWSVSKSTSYNMGKKKSKSSKKK